METYIAFTSEPIVSPAAGSAGREIGAELEFHGIVRETEHGAAIAGLQYEAYVPMAEREIARIIAGLNTQWPCETVWFIHRIGWVPVGEPSLYIRIRSSHRQQAFHFCMALIDQLKTDAPIWKRAALPENISQPGRSPLDS
jgi:molybdopterin synthase catalytic subunit